MIASLDSRPLLMLPRRPPIRLMLASRLLLMLRRPPRIGLIEVARRLGVARGTVQARLEKLQSRGVVTGFGPDVEPAEMGYPVLAFVALEIVQGRLDEAVEGLKRV